MVAPPVTTRAGSTVHARYARTACHWPSSWLAADRRSEGRARMHRTLAASSGGARMKAGDACAFCRCRPLRCCARSRLERGDHRHDRTTMHRGQRAFALLLLSDPRSARNRYAAAGACSVHDRSSNQVARPFLALTSVNAFVTGRQSCDPVELRRRPSDGCRFGCRGDGDCCERGLATQTGMAPVT